MSENKEEQPDWMQRERENELREKNRKEIVNLNDWRFSIGGTVTGKLDTGKLVRTSPIRARNPEQNLVQTASGTIYKLKDISPESHPEEWMWDDNGWIAGGVSPIPRIPEEELR